MSQERPGITLQAYRAGPGRLPARGRLSEPVPSAQPLGPWFVFRVSHSLGLSRFPFCSCCTARFIAWGYRSSSSSTGAGLRADRPGRAYQGARTSPELQDERILELGPAARERVQGARPGSGRRERGPATREHGPLAPGLEKRPPSPAAPALARFHAVNVCQNSFDPHPHPRG